MMTALTTPSMMAVDVFGQLLEARLLWGGPRLCHGNHGDRSGLDPGRTNHEPPDHLKISTAQ